MELSTAGLDPERIRDVNARYHDVAAAGYDSKWGIDYGEVGRAQVRRKLAKALGRQPARYERSLEIGAGTGYFSLNLLLDGVIDRATATDISAGMLARLSATAETIGAEIATVQCDAEELPFEDGSFDIVFGHAVLHHLPDLERALSEFHRVLAPGGTLAFMGEPSRHGDRIASLPKRAGALAAPAWRRLVGARMTGGDVNGDDTVEDDHSLERFVDVHTFTPSELESLAQGSGFEAVRVSGEELVANFYGWFMRTLEAGSEPLTVPYAWHAFAFRSYLTLQWLDDRLLEPRLPPELFYNLLVSGRKPSS